VVSYPQFSGAMKDDEITKTINHESKNHKFIPKSSCYNKESVVHSSLHNAVPTKETQKKTSQHRSAAKTQRNPIVPLRMSNPIRYVMRI